MKILCIRFSALGDVAMLAPVVREYALSHPTDYITVLSRPFCAPLFDDIASNVHFLGRDVKNDYKGLNGLFRLFRELHQMHFDYICDMHDVLRTKVLRFYFRLWGYKVSKIDKHRELRKLITAPEGKKVLKQLPTSFENYEASLLPVGHHLPLKGKGGIRQNSPILQIEGSWIGLAPFAAHEGKIYPLDKMEKVVSMLSEKGYAIYLFGGGKKEKDIMLQWAGRYDGVHLASETCNGLRDELQLMKKLHCMVSMDSANMHLASLVGTRVVSIWGATHPYAGFLGWGQSHEDCVQVDLPCRPCSIYGNKPCLRGDMACMNMITPEEIISRVKSDK